jgi:hypothetical protein
MRRYMADQKNFYAFEAYETEPGAYRLPSGPCKGKRLDELSDEFLRLVAERNWDARVRELAARVLGERAEELADDEDPTQPSQVPAAIALPRVVFELEQFALERFGRDPAGKSVAAEVIEFLKRKCEGFTNKPFRLPTFTDERTSE